MEIRPVNIARSMTESILNAVSIVKFDRFVYLFSQWNVSITTIHQQLHRQEAQLYQVQQQTHDAGETEQAPTWDHRVRYCDRVSKIGHNFVIRIETVSRIQGMYIYIYIYIYISNSKYSSERNTLWQHEAAWRGVRGVGRYAIITNAIYSSTWADPPRCLSGPLETHRFASQ